MSVTKNKAFRFLGSLSLAIFLLSFIATGSIFGTIIKQKADPGEYRALYSENVRKVIFFLSLDDVYHSSWFIAATAFFAVNLTLCTVVRFRKFLRTERQISIPGERELSAMTACFKCPTDRPYEAILKARGGYKTVYADEDGVILDKGSLSRYGVYIIHGSILIILVGSLIGLLFGYKGFVTLRKGEEKDFVIIRGEKHREMPLEFSLRCKNFQVSFYPGGQPKDYASTVEIVKNGDALFERVIRVNHPLNYKGVNIYQSTYGISSSFRFSIDGEEVTLMERETYEKDGLMLMVVGYEDSIHNFGPGVMVAYLDDGEPKTMWFLRDVEKMREKRVVGKSIRLEEVIRGYYTGLEVSKDPGIWVVWTGFASILFGLYINFFISHRRIYIRKTADWVIIAGHTRKNREVFREEFEGLRERVMIHGS